MGYEGELSFETFGQVTLERVDPETVPIWLKTIHDIGVVFKEKIEG